MTDNSKSKPEINVIIFDDNKSQSDESGIKGHKKANNQSELKENSTPRKTEKNESVIDKSKTSHIGHGIDKIKIMQTGEKNLYNALQTLKDSQSIKSPKSPNFAQSLHFDANGERNETQLRTKYPSFN